MSGLFDKTVQNKSDKVIVKKICHHPMCLALDSLKVSTTGNCALLDTANDFDDGVRRTHVMGASRGDDTIYFNLQLIFTSK